jgi:hypothetical protein
MRATSARRRFSRGSETFETTAPDNVALQRGTDRRQLLDLMASWLTMRGQFRLTEHVPARTRSGQ